MASEPIALDIDSTGPSTPKPHQDRDFSDSQLKPAPLRLSRKSQSSNEDVFNSAALPPSIEDASQRGISTTDGPGTPPTLLTPTRINQLPILELTPPPARQPAPSLAPIVSRYEVLEAISHIDSRALSGPSSPRRHPRTPTQARPSPLSSKPQSLFREESPFRKLPRLAVPTSDRKSAGSDYYTQVSPTTITSPASLKGRLRSVAQKGKSPAERRKDTSIQEEEEHQERQGHTGAEGSWRSGKHHVTHDQAENPPGAVPAKRLSRPRTDDITGWDPKIVSERRKVFERGKFTEPTVTRATIASSSLGYDTAQELPMSSPAATKKHSHPTGSSSSRFLLPEAVDNSSQRKWNSVADLRLSFERASGSVTKMSVTHEMPPPLRPARVATHSKIPVTPRRRDIMTATSATEGMLAGHTAPAKYSRAAYKDEEQKHTPRHADLLHQSPVRNSIPTGYYSASHVRVLKESISASSMPKASRQLLARRQIKSDKAEDDTPKGVDHLDTPQSRSNVEYPYLRPRILSVKISTTDPTSDGTGARNSVPQSGGRGGVDRQKPPTGKVQALRTVFDRPQEPAMFLPFIQRGRRDTAPAKSAPSLPITVSTTVAVSTQRTSSHDRSSSGGSVIVSSRAGQATRSRGSSSGPDPRGEYPETPSRPPRNKLKKRRDSPVKDRISLFENMTQTGGSAMSLPTAGRSKSYDAGTASRMDKKRVPGWEFKRGSKMFRVLSFGSNKGAAAKADNKSKVGSKVVTAKSSLEAMKRHSIAGPITTRRLTKLPFLQSATARRETAIIVRGTVYKVPNYGAGPEQLTAPTKATAPTNTIVWSSLDLVNNTSETPPTLFHAESTRSGRILPTRKSYGALEPKSDWEQNADTAFTNPFRDVSSGTQDAELSVTDCSLPSTIAKSAASHADAAASPKRRSRYPSSFGRKAGQTLKRNALGPILSPDEGRAVPSRRSSLSHSWGRRAAAAAFAIGRRLKERRTSGSRSLSIQSRDVSGTGGPPRPASRDEQWDVFVATPNGGLQHPRPARVVNFTKFEGYDTDRGGHTRVQAQGSSGKL
ncbi:hypothetical protein B0T16DRAFT_460178 [Cercophora newfieldiana]|uniref:Uncharacterized protein n=1 Tax=Cercophora newfieldiana TaxID=92897 RepID=A0AA39Y1L8_9PEZI|nr:hypothetical protein B0T16DRAFT_460178 [Cercophora newfieldiana]